MSLSMKESSSLLEFLNEEQVTNKQFDAFASAFQKAGFSKQVRCIFKYIYCVSPPKEICIFFPALATGGSRNLRNEFCYNIKQKIRAQQQMPSHQQI